MNQPKVPSTPKTAKTAQKNKYRKALLKTIAVKVSIITLANGVTGMVDNLPVNILVQCVAAVVTQTRDEKTTQQINERIDDLEDRR